MQWTMMDLHIGIGEWEFGTLDVCLSIMPHLSLINALFVVLAIKL